MILFVMDTFKFLVLYLLIFVGFYYIVKLFYINLVKIGKVQVADKIYFFWAFLNYFFIFTMIGVFTRYSVMNYQVNILSNIIMGGFYGIIALLLYRKIFLTKVKTKESNILLNFRSCDLRKNGFNFFRCFGSFAFVIVLVLMILFMIDFNTMTNKVQFLDKGEEICLKNLEIGDLMFSHLGLLDRFLPGFWSHIGVFAGYDGFGQGWVIESLSQTGVHKVKLEEFFDGSYVSIGKIKNVSWYDRIKVVTWMETKVGYPYDFYIIDKQVEGNSYYCSELIWAGYKQIGVDIDKNPGYAVKYFWAVGPQEMFRDDSLDLYYIRDC